VRVFIGIGSNLGDRQANVLSALQRLRARANVRRVSSFYESAPAGGAQGPAFLNVAAELETSLGIDEFRRFAREVESAVGRFSTKKLAARPIDIDILWTASFVHPDLASRPYNAVPFSEIAPELCAGVPLTANGMRKLPRSLHFNANRQEETPDVRLGLSRVGVSRVRRIVHLRIDGAERVYNGEFTMVADLAPDKAGVHMSRFSEILEEAALDVLARENAAPIERIVEAIAKEIVQSQRAVRADVRLRADFGLERWTPVSGKRGEETYTLVGIAHADAEGTRRVIGVEAEGMTACPCAQLMVREHSTHQLAEAGFTQEQARRALDALPVATHNQRGRGSILIGTPDADAMEAIRAEDLVELVEQAMSSETYDLLKRPDEFFIVNKAHQNPKFVEDVVRGILSGALEMYEDFGDETFVAATQVNYESIHKHDAFAESSGTFGEFRSELRSGAYVAHKTDLAAWLRCQPHVLAQ
jgi:GTP cyclohydrolase-4